MNRTLLIGVLATVVAALTAAAPAVGAETATRTGDNIAPVYEGWQKNADGTFDMLFGYFNRNYEEEPIVPVGPDNNFEPLGPDAGQPTYFYPRRNMFVFRVTVPKDWGDKDLVWTLTVNGKTEKAYGSLSTIWEIDRELVAKNKGRAASNLQVVNADQPPTIEVGQLPQVSPGESVELVATVRDDGQPDTPARSRPAAERFSNVPSRVLAPPPRSGLSIMWIQYRGPAKVQLEPRGYRSTEAGTPIAARASFPVSGTYVLRAIASDSLMDATEDVTITVPPAGEAPAR
jgi:hypothetical protein